MVIVGLACWWCFFHLEFFISSVSERRLGSTHAHTQVFPQQKEEALQQTRLPMHIPCSSLPCLPACLLSSTTPSLLSLSVSHSSRNTLSAERGGMGALSNIQLNQTGGEARKKRKEKKRRRDFISQIENTQGQFQSVQNCLRE